MLLIIYLIYKMILMIMLISWDLINILKIFVYKYILCLRDLKYFGLITDNRGTYLYTNHITKKLVRLVIGIKKTMVKLFYSIKLLFYNRINLIGFK